MASSFPFPTILYIIIIIIIMMKGMVENIKRVSERANVTDPKDQHAGICTNPQEGA